MCSYRWHTAVRHSDGLAGRGPQSLAAVGAVASIDIAPSIVAVNSAVGASDRCDCPGALGGIEVVATAVRIGRMRGVVRLRRWAFARSLGPPHRHVCSASMGGNHWARVDWGMRRMPENDWEVCLLTILFSFFDRGMKT